MGHAAARPEETKVAVGGPATGAVIAATGIVVAAVGILGAGRGRIRLINLHHAG